MLRQLVLHSGAALTRSGAGASSLVPLAQRLRARHKSDDADDTHPDFAPVAKQPDDAASVHAYIAAEVTKHPVLVFMKGTPTAPQCGFSNIVCRVLDSHGVKYASRNVLQDAALREAIKTFTNWPTIPQVFIGGEFVGGSDILMGMHTSGELAEQLQKLKK